MLTLNNVKKDFPIFKSHPDLVYLDSAATTQKPNCVISRIVNFYTNENANVHRGIYDLSEMSSKAYENSRKIVASFINAYSQNEIIFTSGSTDSINLIGYTWIWQNVLKGDTIMSTLMEHHSNFIIWQQISKHRPNVNFKIVKLTKQFEIDYTDLEEKLKKYKPKIFAVSHVSNTLGTINDIEKIVRIRNKVSKNTKILLDAAQSIAHIPVDVKRFGIDFLVFSGHKLYGETGIGVLWAKEKILENMSPFRFGGGMISKVTLNESEWAQIPYKFEAGTPHISGAIALAEAIKYVQKFGFDNIRAHENEISKYFLKKIADIPELKLLGHKLLKNRIGVFSFVIKGMHPHDIAEILNEDNIAVRAGHHCTMPLHEFYREGSSVRVSLGVYNTLEDIDKLIKGLLKARAILKR